MKFTKMHGLGNDFILFDGTVISNVDYNMLAKAVCDRHLGVGADGIMVVLPSQKADIKMRIINADGSEAEMCGNGIRCFAKYVFDRGIVKKDRFTVETLAGIMEPELILKDGKVDKVKVNMGKPGLERKDIPMKGPDGQVIGEKLDVNGETFVISSLLMGVPHTMVYVDNVDKTDISRIGPAIEKHPVFPKKTNVNFVELLSESEIKVRTWERGAGITLACGTGSCASVVASHLAGKTGRKVTVHLAIGDLEIEWDKNDVVFMTGPAQEVFTGEFDEKIMLNG